MNRFCQICNIEYIKDKNVCSKQWAKSRFCSSKCKCIWMSKTFSSKNNPTYKGKLVVVCQVCSKEFEVYPYRKNTVRFCSYKCHGSTRFGENGRNWQGGITPINAKIRESLEYEEWRKKVFVRDKYTCQQCGVIGGKIEADHIKMFSRYPELRFDVSNGQTLCKMCHRIKTIQDLKSNWSNQYKRIESLN